jgi:hypothetical protein
MFQVYICKRLVVYYRNISMESMQNIWVKMVKYRVLHYWGPESAYEHVRVCSLM